MRLAPCRRGSVGGTSATLEFPLLFFWKSQLKYGSETQTELNSEAPLPPANAVCVNRSSVCFLCPLQAKCCCACDALQLLRVAAVHHQRGSCCTTLQLLCIPSSNKDAKAIRSPHAHALPMASRARALEIEWKVFHFVGGGPACNRTAVDQKNGSAVTSAGC